ncbi:MAG TPA: potassium channel family protein [Candidatus Dormibacteraeota bacterium]|jgi:hypothetical protein|nr:potassium channel family protein [Candidatus Dormibacteraeota bacterium]
MNFLEAHWALSISTLYIFLLVIFAVIYFKVYVNDPTSFLFQTEISTTQSKRILADCDDEIHNLEIQMAAMRELLAGSASKPKVYSATHVSEHFIFELSAGSNLDSEDPISFLTVLVKSNAGVRVCKWRWGTGLLEVPVWEGVEDYAKTYEGHLAKRLKGAQDLREQAKLSIARIWGFFDFLYFSGVTITTVGYGDILPNRTLVRILVLIEVLAGLMLLGIAVALLSSHSI